MSQTMPLLDLFIELRRRHLNLGPREYFDALQAIVASQAVHSRRELSWLLQAVWGSSIEDQKLIEMTAKAFLPPEITAEFLNSLDGENRPENRRDATQTPAASAASQAVEPAAIPESVLEQQPNSPQVEFDMVDQTVGPSIAVSGPAENKYRMKSPYDLVGDMPVTRRHIKRSWRYYRRMRRFGRPVELDVPATIRQIARNGVLDSPQLVPRRQNCAKVLILMDAGGSMNPFQLATDELIETAKSSGFARLEIAYFHDVPREYVFCDETLSEPRDLLRTLADFADAGVLIVSDAGAARGKLDPYRLEATLDFLSKAARLAPRLAWLNPVPRDRWDKTTAGEISADSATKMFSMNRAGLDAAVHFMRGHID